MSKNELGRVEVLARVKSKQLRVVDAALLLRVSYRQSKRLWKLYRRTLVNDFVARNRRPITQSDIATCESRDVPTLMAIMIQA